MSAQEFCGKWKVYAWRARVAGAALIILFTVLAYLPALSGKFIWDDDSWTTVIAPLLRDFAGLRAIWCQPTALQQYYPLAGTTFWIDYQLWGFHPLPYHVENILLHAFAALLFWQLLRRLRVPGAWLASALFALHPVMVESVAWITERKNVLSLVLYLGALLAYLRYTERVSGDKWQVTRTDSFLSRVTCHVSLLYGLAFVLFVAALLAKATAFSLPAAILLIAWWQRGRIRWRADVLPTLPFFAVAIGLCLGTAWLEKNHVGAKGPEWVISFPERCLIAGRALWFYTGKLFWPAELCFIYPRWQLNAGAWWQWLYPVTAVGALFTLWLTRARIGRGPLAAALFFGGTLFPVLGFMNAYFMRYSFVCDHWVYLSSLGIFALAAGLIAWAAERFRMRAALYGFAVLILPMLALLTWRQCAIYANIETLWQDTLTKNPGAWLAHNNLGIVLLDEGRIQEAVEHGNWAVKIQPDSPEVHNNLALALAQQGRVEEEIGQYEQALRLKPDYPEAHLNLGLALAQQGKLEEAIAHWKQALQARPDYPEAHYNWGVALEQLGRKNDAIWQYKTALRFKPDYVEARDNLGNALLTAGRIPEAVELYNMAVRTRPNSAEAHNNLAIAYAAAGRFNDAIASAEKAIELARSAGQSQLVEEIQARMELYRKELR